MAPHWSQYRYAGRSGQGMTDTERILMLLQGLQGVGSMFGDLGKLMMAGKAQEREQEAHDRAGELHKLKKKSLEDQKIADALLIQHVKNMGKEGEGMGKFAAALETLPISDTAKAGALGQYMQTEAFGRTQRQKDLQIKELQQKLEVTKSQIARPLFADITSFSSYRL